MGFLVKVSVNCYKLNCNFVLILYSSRLQELCSITTSTRTKCVIHYVFSFQFTHAQHSDRITQGTLVTT